jgi:Rps23 Pro-64 3,4-dihydroxylase Tpa1-like proline 4-hydroxylase
MSVQIRLNPDLDRRALRETFDRTGRLHVPQVLEAASARLLHETLQASRDWIFVFNRGNRHFEVTPRNFAAMPQEAKIQMQRDILENARDGFQLAYDVINVSKKTSGPMTGDPVLVALHTFMNGPDYIGFLKDITGEIRGAWCDVTATRYKPGHFCEAHDDSADDGERLIAFVLNLTPRWRPDWGGLLLFLDQRGHVSQGLTPAFNALNLFRTPQMHSVSAVAPFAGANRLSVTGWLRPAA